MHPLFAKRLLLRDIFTLFVFGALAASSAMSMETNTPTALSLLPALATRATMTSGSPETLLKLLSAGGLVMIPLLVLSVITLALILVYLVILRRGAVAGSRFMTMAETLLGKGDLLGLLAIANKHSDIAASILTRTLEFLASHPGVTDDQLREIAQTEGSREASLLNQRAAWLADIATVAPMLGLLGTVFGMIRSFSVMANDVAASRPMLLAEGGGRGPRRNGCGTCRGHSCDDRLCMVPREGSGNDFRNGGGNLPSAGEARDRQKEFADTPLILTVCREFPHAPTTGATGLPDRPDGRHPACAAWVLHAHMEFCPTGTRTRRPDALGGRG